MSSFALVPQSSPSILEQLLEFLGPGNFILALFFLVLTHLAAFVVGAFSAFLYFKYLQPAAPVVEVVEPLPVPEEPEPELIGAPAAAPPFAVSLSRIQRATRAGHRARLVIEGVRERPGRTHPLVPRVENHFYVIARGQTSRTPRGFVHTLDQLEIFVGVPASNFCLFHGFETFAEAEAYFVAAVGGPLLSLV